MHHQTLVKITEVTPGGNLKVVPPAKKRRARSNEREMPPDIQSALDGTDPSPIKKRALADLGRAKAKYSMVTALANVWLEVGKVQAKSAPKGKPAAPPSRRKPARGEDRPSA